MQLPVVSRDPFTPAEARCVRTPQRGGVLKLSAEGYLPPDHPETLVAITGPASVLLSQDNESSAKSPRWVIDIKCGRSCFFFLIYLSFLSNLHKCDGKLQFDLCKKRGSLYRSIKSYYNKESCHSNVCSVCCVMVICGCWRVWFCVVSLWSSSIPDSSPSAFQRILQFPVNFLDFSEGSISSLMGSCPLLTWEFLVNWDYLHRSSNSSSLTLIMGVRKWESLLLQVCLCVWEGGRDYFLALEPVDNTGTHITCPPDPVSTATCAGVLSCGAFTANLFAPLAAFE